MATSKALILGGSQILILTTDQFLNSGADYIQLSGLNAFGQVLPEVTLNIVNGETLPETIKVILPSISSLNTIPAKITINTEKTSVKSVLVYPITAISDSEKNFINNAKSFTIVSDNPMKNTEFNLVSSDQWYVYGLA